MKDKLVKNGKKRRFYSFRKFLLIGLLFTALSASVVIPVSVKAYNDTKTNLVVRS